MDSCVSEGCSEELRGSGITVTAVCPGPVHTNFFEAAGVDMSAAPQWLWATPEQVVSEALAAMRRGAGVGNSNAGLQGGNGCNAGCSALGHAPRYALDSAYVAFCVVNGGIDASALLL